MQNVKTYVFIDASNIIYGVLKYDGWKVDLLKLKKYLESRYGAQKIFYYAGIEPDNEKQKLFYKKLEDEFGYTVCLKKVKFYTGEDGSVVRKANCDVDMTFDMMRFLGQYARAVVLTGDGDFCCVVEYLVKKGREIRIIANANRAARDLRIVAGDKFIDIRSLRPIIELKKEGLI